MKLEVSDAEFKVLTESVSRFLYHLTDVIDESQPGSEPLKDKMRTTLALLERWGGLEQQLIPLDGPSAANFDEFRQELDKHPIQGSIIAGIPIGNMAQILVSDAEFEQLQNIAADDSPPSEELVNLVNPTSK